MHPPHFKPTSKELRLFTLVLLIPAAVLHFSFHYTTAAIVLASYASLGLLIPTLAKPLDKLLLVSTRPIGFCLNHLLLATPNNLLLTPIAFIFRLRKKTLLNLSYPPKTTTNFSRLEKPEPRSYYNPF